MESHFLKMGIKSPLWLPDEIEMRHLYAILCTMFHRYGLYRADFLFYADRLNENSCSCLSLLLRGITSVFNNTTGNTVCQSLCFLYRGRITQIQSLFYAFRGIEAHENQGFSATVGGQAGQIIQSPPKLALKCVENNP